MLYTTNLIKIMRRVNVVGFIENHCTFIDNNSIKTDGVLSNTALKAMLNLERSPLTVESDHGVDVRAFQLNHKDSAYSDIKLNECPVCNSKVEGDICVSTTCKGRKVDNFRKVLTMLGIYYEGNESLLKMESNYDPSLVLEKKYYRKEYANNPKVIVVNEIIDNVKGMHVTPALFMLGRLCCLSNTEMDLLAEHVNSEEELLNLHLSKVSEYEGIKRLIDYLDTPYSDWLQTLELRYR